MTTFTINEQNDIVAFATPAEAAAATATPFDSFSSQQELAELAAAWTGERLVAIWNSLTGVTPVQKFKNRTAAVKRIWARIQGLGEAAEPTTDLPAKPKTAGKVKGGARVAKVAPAKAKAFSKVRAAKATPKGKKAAQSAGVRTPRDGSKMAQVIAMLRRKNGAALDEICQSQNWLRHTTRGFIAGTLKKAGLVVESYKDDKTGARTYRIAT